VISKGIGKYAEYAEALRVTRKYVSCVERRCQGNPRNSFLKLQLREIRGICGGPYIHKGPAGEKVIGVPKSVRVQIAQAAAGQPARAHGC